MSIPPQKSSVQTLDSVFPSAKALSAPRGLAAATPIALPRQRERDIWTANDRRVRISDTEKKKKKEIYRCDNADGNKKSKTGSEEAAALDHIFRSFQRHNCGRLLIKI